MQLAFAVSIYLNAHHGLISPKTLRIYDQSLRLLLEHLGDCDISAVSIDDLRTYRGWLFDRTERYGSNTSRPTEAGGLSVWTIHGHIRVVRQLFKWLADEGKLAANPARRLELPTLGNEPPKGITESDLQKMIAVVNDSPRDRAILLFLADTGCRIGGATGLRLPDLDLEKRAAIVREKGKGGQKKTRAVFFTASTAAALALWLQERKMHCKSSGTDLVFLGRKGPLTTDGIYQIVERTGKRAGVQGRFNPHSFRHGFARALLERGLDLGRVSRLLGHSDERVTARFYGVFSQQELADAHDKYSWIK